MDWYLPQPKSSATWNTSRSAVIERRFLAKAIELDNPSNLEHQVTEFNANVNQIINGYYNGQRLSVTPLMYAVLKHNLKLVKLLVVRHKADVSASCPLDWRNPRTRRTALDIALEVGANVELVGFLLRHMRLAGNLSSFSNTITFQPNRRLADLHWAIFKGYFGAAVKLFDFVEPAKDQCLFNSAKLLIPGAFGVPLLSVIVRNISCANYMDAYRLLDKFIGAGYNLNRTWVANCHDVQSQYSHNECIGYDLQELVDYFRRKEIQIDYNVGGRNSTPLAMAINRRRNLEMAKVLIKNGATLSRTRIEYGEMGSESGSMLCYIFNFNQEKYPRVKLSDVDLAMEYANGYMGTVLILLANYKGTYDISDSVYVMMFNFMEQKGECFDQFAVELQQVFDSLYTRGFDINQTGRQPLMRTRIRKMTDIDCATPTTFVQEEEYGLIHILTAIGQKKLLQFVLNQPNVDVNLKTLSGRSALYFGVHVDGDRKDICRILVEKGIDVNYEPDLLGALIRCHNSELCRKFLKWGCQPRGSTELQACLNTFQIRLACVLVDYCSTSSIEDVIFDGMADEVYNQFSFNQLEEFLMKCVGRGFKLDSVSPRTGNSLIHYALKDDRERLYALLRKHGVRVDVPNREGYFPVHIAVLHNSSLLRKFLRDYPDEVRRETASGLSALCFAICTKNLHAVTILATCPPRPKNSQLSFAAWLFAGVSLKVSSHFIGILSMLQPRASAEQGLREFLWLLDGMPLTPIRLACAMSQTKMVEVLLNRFGPKSVCLVDFHLSLLSGNTKMAVMILDSLSPNDSLEDFETLGFPSLQLWAWTTVGQEWTSECWQLLRNAKKRDYDLNYQNSNSPKVPKILCRFLRSPNRSVRSLRILLEDFNLDVNSKDICGQCAITTLICGHTSMSVTILKELVSHCINLKNVKFTHYQFRSGHGEILMMLYKGGATFLQDFKYRCAPTYAEVSRRPLLGAEFREFCGWLEGVQKQPRSLQEMSRNVLRTLPNVYSWLKTTDEYPQPLNRYIRMENEVRVVTTWIEGRPRGNVGPKRHTYPVIEVGQQF